MVEEPSVVERTGLVVLTQGEIVVSAQDSEVVMSKVRQDALVFEFPVEVEVRIVPACDPDQHVQTTLAQLTSALEGLV
jgi:hypothetical protein